MMNQSNNMSSEQQQQVTNHATIGKVWKIMKRAVIDGKKALVNVLEDYRHAIPQQMGNTESSTSSQSSPTSVANDFNFNSKMHGDRGIQAPSLSTESINNHIRYSHSRQILYRESSMDSPTSSITATSSTQHHNKDKAIPRPASSFVNQASNIPIQRINNHDGNDPFQNDNGKFGNSQVKMKMILLDSLILRLKRFYGEEAEIICDQALFAAIMDIKKACTQRVVDLSIVDDIEIVFQQLIDNEAIYRLERSSKLDTERWQHEKSLATNTANTRAEIENKKLELHNSIATNVFRIIFVVVVIVVAIVIQRLIL